MEARLVRPVSARTKAGQYLRAESPFRQRRYGSPTMQASHGSHRAFRASRDSSARLMRGQCGRQRRVSRGAPLREQEIRLLQKLDQVLPRGFRKRHSRNQPRAQGSHRKTRPASNDRQRRWPHPERLGHFTYECGYAVELLISKRAAERPMNQGC